jgi:hypothetical protein
MVERHPLLINKVDDATDQEKLADDMEDAKEQELETEELNDEQVWRQKTRRAMVEFMDQYRYRGCNEVRLTMESISSGHYAMSMTPVQATAQLAKTSQALESQDPTVDAVFISTPVGMPILSVRNPTLCV